MPCPFPSGPSRRKTGYPLPSPSQQAREIFCPLLAPTDSSSWVEELSGEKPQGREGRWDYVLSKLPVTLGHQAPTSGFHSNLTLERSLCLQGRTLPRDAPWWGRGQEGAMGEALEMVPVGRGGRGQVGPVEASCWGCSPSSAEPLTALPPSSRGKSDSLP